MKTRDDLNKFIDDKFKENSWQGIQAIFDALVENTEKGAIIDPYINPNFDFWNGVWFVLYYNNKQYPEALTLAQRFLDTYYSVQGKHQERIHK